MKKTFLYPVIFFSFVFSRLLTLHIMGPLWFLKDEILDNCIKPWRLFSDPVTTYDQSTLVILIYGTIRTFIGSSIFAPRLFTILVFSGMMLLFFSATRRIFGPRVAYLSIIILLVSHIFITRSIIATTMPSGFWCPIIIFWLLSKGISRKRFIIMCLVTTASLFCYPGGAIVSIALIIMSFAIFWKKIFKTNGVNYSLLLKCVGTICSIFIGTRYLVNHKLIFNRWGIYSTDFLPNYTPISRMLQEIFVAADSWYSFSGGAPCLGLEIFWILLVSLIIRAIFNFKHGNRFRFSPRSKFRLLWAIILLLTFIISIIALSTVPKYPGLRRILPLVPFIVIFFSMLISTLVPRSLNTWIYPFLGMTWVFFISYRSITFLPKAFPLNHYKYLGDSYIELSRAISQYPSSTKVFFNAKNNTTEAFACLLYFDRLISQAYLSKEVDFHATTKEDNTIGIISSESIAKDWTPPPNLNVQRIPEPPSPTLLYLLGKK